MFADTQSAAYRASHQPGVQLPLEINSHDVYHALNPLPALSPVPRFEDSTTADSQSRNEALYRQLLVQAILSILLPTEDLENPCLTALVEQIFSELIIGNVVINKASQPWLLYEGICIIARVLQQKKAGPKDGAAISMIGRRRRQWSMQSVLFSVISCITLLVTSLRLCFKSLIAASSLPTRSRNTDTASNHADGKRPARNAARPAVPVIEFRFWTCLGTVTELNSRMPWLHGMLSLIQYGVVYGPWQIAAVDGLLDR